MRKIVSALKPWKWCLIGGRAVEIWTNPPQTPDIDLLVDVTDETVNSLCDSFRARGVQVNELVEGLGSPMVFLKDHALKVELDVIGAYEELHFSIIRRAVTKTVQAVRFPVAYAEDIVILKSQALVDPGRRSDKKRRDRQAVRDIAASVKLDKAYIREALDVSGWSEELKMLQLMRVV